MTLELFLVIILLPIITGIIVGLINYYTMSYYMKKKDELRAAHRKEMDKLRRKKSV